MRNSKKGLVLPIAILLLIIALIIYFISMTVKAGQVVSNRNRSETDLINNGNFTSHNPGLEQEQDIKGTSVSNLPVKYKIKIYSITYDITANKEKKYEMDDLFEINTKISIGEHPILSFTVNNGETTFEDMLLYDDEEIEEYKRETKFKFNYYRIGDYLGFKNHNSNKSRSTHLYLVDKQGNLYKDLYELDESKGMCIDNIKFKRGSITISASRITEDKDIIYDGKSVKTNQELKDTIPNETAIKATYTYIMSENGVIDFEKPNVQIEKTFNDYIIDNI